VAFRAPLNLKDPVRCMASTLKNRLRLDCLLSDVQVRTGVLWDIPLIFVAALSTSWKVIQWSGLGEEVLVAI